METVYAIQYDSKNQVLHAATGENKGKEAVGLTFDAKKDTFGKFLQKWNGDNRDLKETHDLAVSSDNSEIYLGQLNGEIDEFTYE